MNCKYHNDINGNNTCNVCGESICENCALETNNKIYCKDCLKKTYKIENNNIVISENSSLSKISSFNKNNNIALYILNLIPGCLPLYLGDKKGLKYLILFFIFLSLNFETFAIVTFIYSFYYGIAIKRKFEKINYIKENNLKINSNQNLMLNENPNKIAFLLSSLVPGCSYLYLGLKKKGLMLLTSFFIFCALNFKPFPIPTIIFLYSLCDSLYIKNNIFKGKEIKNIDQN